MRVKREGGHDYGKKGTQPKERQVLEMKLKPIVLKPVVIPQPEKKPRKPSSNTLPPDVYEPEFDPVRFLTREFHSDSGSIVKQYLEISVKRFNDDEGLPFVWIQMYQESEKYTGYLKGKTVYFPLEMLYEVLDNLSFIDIECEKRKIE